MSPCLSTTFATTAKKKLIVGILFLLLGERLDFLFAKGKKMKNLESLRRQLALAYHARRVIGTPDRDLQLRIEELEKRVAKARVKEENKKKS